MSDIAIASATQSPNQTPGAVSGTQKVASSTGFMDMLLGSSTHRMAKSSQLFVAGNSIDAAFSRSEPRSEDWQDLPAPTNETRPQEEDWQRTEVDDRARDERQPDGSDTNREPDVTAGLSSPQADAKETSKTGQGDQAAPVQAVVADKQRGARSDAAAPNAGTTIAGETEVAVPAGKSNEKSGQAQPAAQGNGAAAVERAGLVSKPQQALAQASTTSVADVRKASQPATAEGDAADGKLNGPPSGPPSQKTGGEPLIQRPVANVQAPANGTITPAPAQTPGGAFGQAVNEAAKAGAASSAPAAPAGSTAASVQAAAPGKTAAMTSMASPVAAETPAAGDMARSKAASFASNLKPSQETFQQLSLQMSRAVSLGRDRISLQLHPAELGRVDVKLEFSQDQGMRAVISAERPETLDLLQRDARALERALQDAGVKLDNNALNFAHKQDQQAGGQFAQTGADGSASSGELQDDGGNAAEAGAQGRRGEPEWHGAVNIEV